MARKLKKASNRAHYGFFLNINKTGYLLLEIIIYLSCSILLGFFLFNFLSKIYSQTNISINNINLYSKLILSNDRIGQDLITLDSDIFYWPILKTDNINFLSNSYNLIWSVSKNRLTRKIIANNKSSISIVANNIDKLSIKYYKKDNNILGLEYKLAAINNKYQIVSTIALRRGIYL